jgi:hypothetical protein
MRPKKLTNTNGKRQNKDRSTSKLQRKQRDNWVKREKYKENSKENRTAKNK